MERERIAIIGAGINGLVAANYLATNDLVRADDARRLTPTAQNVLGPPADNLSARVVARGHDRVVMRGAARGAAGLPAFEIYADFAAHFRSPHGRCHDVDDDRDDETDDDQSHLFRHNVNLAIGVSSDTGAT